jgi:hypothetical protein
MQTPCGVSGPFNARALIAVKVRNDRDSEEVARRLAAKYHFDLSPTRTVQKFYIPDGMTELAGRELLERLRCEPDVEAIDFVPKMYPN